MLCPAQLTGVAVPRPPKPQHVCQATLRIQCRSPQALPHQAGAAWLQIGPISNCVLCGVGYVIREDAVFGLPSTNALDGSPILVQKLALQLALGLVLREAQRVLDAEEQKRLLESCTPADPLTAQPSRRVVPELADYGARRSSRSLKPKSASSRLLRTRP